MAAPITGLYAGLLGLFILVLAVRVVAVRRSAGIGLGDGGNDTLLQRVRAHGNAAEFVPLALLLMLLAELGGASSAFLHTLGVALVAGRLLHAQGLAQSAGNSPGRFVGNILTWICIVVASVRLIGAGLG